MNGAQIIARELRVTRVERGLDVQAHPIEQRQRGAQTVREHPRRVQTGEESARAHGLQCALQAGVQRGLAAAKHHGLDAAAPALEQIDHLRPRPRNRGRRIAQRGVVAIIAAPRAALREHHQREAVGVIHRGQRRHARHRQQIRPRHGQRVPGENRRLSKAKRFVHIQK